MLELKSCPRCLGDMLANRDMYGYYRKCLQCGFMIDLGPPEKIGRLWPLALRDEKSGAA